MENRSIHDDVWLAPWDPEWAHPSYLLSSFTACICILANWEEQMVA